MKENKESVAETFTYMKPMELFSTKSMVKIAAPMVRYSKLQFRELTRLYHCDLSYTSMIMSNSFIRSQKSRDIEFTTNPTDRPLIVQFAANNVDDLATASAFVSNHCDGIELNCGCPQQWALKEVKIRFKFYLFFLFDDCCRELVRL